MNINVYKNKLILALLNAFLLLAPTSTTIAKSTDYVKEVQRYESVTLPGTQIRHLHSNFTNKNYKIYVDVPASYYQHPNKKYPAIFLLDADYSFPIAKSIVEHLEDRHRIQEVFVFGIAYDGPPNYKLNRTQDYTPTFTLKGGYGKQYQKFSGGGPKFEKFLQKELLPYLNNAFRLNRNTTIVGHSYGGLFVTWLSLTHPKAFHNVISISPSLWYDDHSILKLQKQQKSHLPSTAKLFFAIGEKENGGSYRMVTDLKNFTQNSKNKKLTLMTFPYDDHDTVFPNALTHGLLYVYNYKKLKQP